MNFRLPTSPMMLLLLASSSNFGSVSGFSLVTTISQSTSSSSRFVSPQPLVVLAASSSSSSTEAGTTSTTDVDGQIAAAKTILVKAAATKQEDSDVVVQALLDLEKLMRQKAKLGDGTSAGEQLRDQLHGDWRLIFTTGTAKTQEKYGKVNYFPIKAVQTFRTRQYPNDSMKITNGIFVGDFPLLKFFGEMDFDVRKRKLEFDFTELLLLNFLKFNLGQGQAAQLGASSGLGSESNVENAKKGRQAFFNWISADDDIATARGGGGGLALWKRVGDGTESDSE